MKNENKTDNKLPIGKKKRSISTDSTYPTTKEISFFAVKSELPPEVETEKQEKIQNRKNNTSSIDKKLDELTSITQKNNNLLNNYESKNYDVNSNSNQIKTSNTNNFIENVKDRNTNTNIENKKIELDSKNIYSVQKENSILNNSDFTNQAKIFNPTFISRSVNPYLSNTVENIKSYNFDSVQNTNPYSLQNIENRSFFNTNKDNSSVNQNIDLMYDNKNNLNYDNKNNLNYDNKNNANYNENNSETNNEDKQNNLTNKNFSISNYKNNLYDNLELSNNESDIKSENKFDVKSPNQYLNINENNKIENISSTKSPQRYIKNGINMIKFENINQEIPTFAAGGEAVIKGQSLIEVGTDINNNPKTEKLKVQADPEMDRVRELIQLTSYKEKQTQSNSNMRQIMTIPTESGAVNSPPPSSNNITIKSMSTLDEVLMLSAFIPSWRSHLA